MATKKNTGVNIIMCMALSAGMILSAWSTKAQAARNGTLDVSVAVEEKVLLSPDKESDSEKVEYNLTEHTGTKKITISVSPDDITRLMLSEFCFDVAGQEPIWSTKSSVTFTLTSRKTEVVVRARSEGDLFYQTTIKLTDGRSYGIVDFVVAILIAIAAVCAIYFWSRLKILRTTLSLENEITDRTHELRRKR